jgi:hypothetical protein
MEERAMLPQLQRMLEDGEKGTLSAIALFAAAQATRHRTKVKSLGVAEPYVELTRKMVDDAMKRFESKTEDELDLIIELCVRHLRNVGIELEEGRKQ